MQIHIRCLPQLHYVGEQKVSKSVSEGYLKEPEPVDATGSLHLYYVILLEKALLIDDEQL